MTRSSPDVVAASLKGRDENRRTLDCGHCAFVMGRLVIDPRCPTHNDKAERVTDVISANWRAHVPSR